MRHITYIVPSSLLHQVSKLLQPPEKMGFFSGVRLLEGYIIVLTQFIPIECKSASRVHGHPDYANLDEKYRAMLSFGMEFEGQAHSHPGKSAPCTHPSQTDFNTAQRWEKDGPFVGMVFSEGGRYVRFFNHMQKSTVHIYGKKTKQLQPGLYELSEDNEAQSPAEVIQGADEGADGQAGASGVVEPKEGKRVGGLRDWLRRARRAYQQDAGPDGD